MSKETKPQIYYFARKGWYEQLGNICDAQIAKKGKDPVSVFWKAFSLGMGGSIQACTKLLETFQARRDMQYPASLALIYFLKRAPSVDHDAISTLQSELSIAEDVAKDAGFVLAARFCLYSGDYQTAIRLSQRLMPRSGNPSTPHEIDGVAVEQWANMAMMEASGDIDWKYIQNIDQVVRGLGDVADVDLLMLQARSRYVLRKKKDTMNVFNKLIATYPWFIPALTEKTLLLASSGEWDQALDTAQRALDMDGQNLDALKVVAVHAFLQEAQPSDCSRKFTDLDDALQRREPNSTQVILETTALFSRICGRQPRALEICRQMLDRALQFRPNDSDLMIELGHVNILQRGYHAALRAFREASRYNSSDVRALEGTVFSHLLAGETDDAEAQIELLELMQSNPDEASAEFYFFKALLIHRQSRGSKEDLTEAAEKHVAMLQNCYFMFFKRYDEAIKGFTEPLKELVVLDLDFIMQMAQAFTAHMEVPMPAFLPPSSSGNAPSFQMFGNSAIAAAQETSKSGETADSDIPPAVETAMGLLRKVLTIAPGCVPAYLELSRVVAALGRPDDALKLLRQCLGMLPTCAAALLLTARIETGRFNTAAADRALEQALSGNFAIRKVILFRYAQAVVRAQQGKTDEALSEIVTLSQLPQLLFSDTNVDGSAGAEDSGDDLENSFLDRLPITDEDRVGVIIAHATLLNKSGKVKDANKLLSDAKVNFAGSSQEIHLLLASSQLAIDRGDFEGAIRSLDKIKSESSFFHRAQVLKGEILLVHNHDKEAFTKCYLSLVESNPNEKSYTLLGEAYLRILNPEKAVDAFEEARKRDSTNTKLRARIGKALTATHEYHRAVAFYENILNDAGPDLSTEIIYLSHDLARLYIKLGRIESATRVLQLVLYPSHKDISEMQMDVKTLELLAFATEQQTAGNAATVGDADERDEEEVLTYLQRGREIQQDVVAQSRGSVAASSEAVEKERNVLSVINEKMGKLYFLTKNYRLADQHLSEALQANPQNAKAMYAMAELYLHKGEVDHCAQQLKKVLTSDPSDEMAAVLLSEVVFKDSDAAEESIKPLQDLLQRHPNSYRTLAKMISILRRVGKLEDIPAFFTRAENSNRRCSGHAGMHFCRGLYARYTNDVIKAVTEFNCCRTDALWGPESLVHMIELYLNPDQDGVWEEREAGSVIDEDVADNISVAERLLRELRPVAKDRKRVQVLQNYLWLATKQKKNVEDAMASFIEMLEDDQNYLPAILGMATGFMVEKSQHKALNLLKRVSKMELSKDDGEDFERANILLAKFYVEKGKNDLAQDLCKRCLMHNKSCSQAWEVLGLAMEKEQDYEHSYECYEKAWKLEFEASAPIGFKLAFTYLKCRKLVEAIDICEKVLDQYPDYPRIKEEILRKAQDSIRSRPM